MSTDFLRDIVKVCVKHNAVPNFVLNLDRNLRLYARYEDELKKHKTMNDICILLGDEFCMSEKNVEKIIYAIKNSQGKVKIKNATD